MANAWFDLEPGSPDALLGASAGSVQFAGLTESSVHRLVICVGHEFVANGLVGGALEFLKKKKRLAQAQV